MTQEGTKTLISVGQMLIVGIKIKKTKTPHHRMYFSGKEPLYAVGINLQCQFSVRT